MPKREIVKRIDQRAAGNAGGTGGVTAAGHADTVDGLHASRTPTAGYLLALGSDAQFPSGVVAFDDVDGVTVDTSPADNEILAYDTSTGEWINQTAEEAGLQTTLTTGDLTANSPLQASATRQVIGGGLTLSLDQAGINHGSIGGLNNDDHTQYLLASGARAGSASQAQDFGVAGIKADAIAESTTGLGVTVDGVLLKDGGGTLAADLNFAGYKAIAMACDQGASFPSSPQTGQWFYRTDAKCLFLYEGAWKPIISFGSMTLYVDGTNGSDAAGQGFSSGTGATATIQYAIDLIPPIVGGSVTVNIAPGNYAAFSMPGKLFTDASAVIYILGSRTIHDSGTMTHRIINMKTAGAGTVNTPSGGSTTVTLGGGGSTSVFYVGAFITANNATRRVTSIIDTTTFTVDSSVDWYNGGAGYSWTYTQRGMRDTGKNWADDSLNGKFICLDTSNPYGAYNGVIEDTVSADSLLVLAAGSLPSTNKSYEIFSIDTSITSGTIIVRSDYVYFRGIDFQANLTLYGSFCRVVGCKFTGKQLSIMDGSINCSVYGCHFYHNGVAYYSAISINRYSQFSLGGTWAEVYYYFLYLFEGPLRVGLYDSRWDHYGSVVEPIRMRQARVDFTTGRNIQIKFGSVTTGITASWLSILEAITGSSALLSVGFTTAYSVDSSTYSIAT